MEKKKDISDRLAAIEKYLPFTVDAVTTVGLLESLGCEKRGIRELLAEGSGSIWNRIVNPENGKAYVVTHVAVKLAVTADRKVEVRLEGKPIQDFFADMEASDARLREIISSNGKESSLARENVQLKDRINRLVERVQSLEDVVRVQDRELEKRRK